MNPVKSQHYCLEYEHLDLGMQMMKQDVVLEASTTSPPNILSLHDGFGLGLFRVQKWHSPY